MKLRNKQDGADAAQLIADWIAVTSFSQEEVKFDPPVYTRFDQIPMWAIWMWRESDSGLSGTRVVQKVGENTLYDSGNDAYFFPENGDLYRLY
jgi:hypothetical protein